MKTLRSLWLGCLGVGPIVAGCSVYDLHLIEETTGGGGGADSVSSGSTANGSGGATTSSSASNGGGGATTTSSGSSGGGGGATSGSTGSGGAARCSSASECPGVDTECTTKVCNAATGVCGFDVAASGKEVAAQVMKDCKKVVCDGLGATKEVDDDADLPDDLLECTVDDCAQGVKTATPKAAGTSCESGTKSCNAAGACVECIENAQCATLYCNAMFQCAAPACDDVVKNGVETDVDCGGPACSPCASGKVCAADGDCGSGKCSAGVCADVLVISEVRSRGLAGGSDEFVELYNPTNAAVVLDNTWKLAARSAVGACAGNASVTKWTGAGQTVEPHRHFLIANTGGASDYTQMPTPDATLSSGITDAASVTLTHGAATVDAICFYYNAATQTNLTTCATPYECEGTPVSNLPHNDTTSAGSNSDASLVRKPGGAAGNGTDTGDNSADFTPKAPAAPENLASPAVP